MWLCQLLRLCVGGRKINYQCRALVEWSASCQALQSIVDLGFQCSGHLFLLLSGHCRPISISHPSVHLFCRLPSFFISSILAVAIYFGLLLLFMLSVCPYHFNLTYFVNFTMSAHCNISCISLFVLILIFLLFFGTIYFSYNLPFECCKSIHFFWHHCPGFCRAVKDGTC